MLRRHQRCSARSRRRTAVIVGLVSVGMLGAAGGAGAAEPWGFEQVTPVDKGSGAVSTSDGFIASPDGTRLFHSSMLPYESLPVTSSPVQVGYAAARGEGGWVNVPLDPPGALPQLPVSNALVVRATLGLSRNLKYAVIASRIPLTAGADPNGAGMYLKNVSTGELRLIYTTDSDSAGYDLFGTANGMNVMYVAGDGRSVLFGVLASRLLPGVPVLFPQGGLYSWTAEHGLRYEIDAGGELLPNGTLPGGDPIGPRDAMPLDDRGLDHVYYQAGQDLGTAPVWVNEGADGARSPRLVTYSRLVPPPAPPATPAPTPGQPLAVGAGGRYALIQTGDNVPIAGGEPADPPAGSRLLYRFDAEATDPADQLEYVGMGPSQSRVVQMSQDGRTIVFYSPFEQAGSPSESQQKLFVWREGHGLKYIYSAAAGSTGTNLTQQLRRLSDNARFLSFTDNSAPLAASFGMTNNVSAACPTITLAPGPCDQTYHYDIEAEELACASCRTDGVAPLGPSGTDQRSGAGQIRMNRYQPRTVADDGTVFFSSQDALVSEDRNGLFDVYAWRSGSGLRLLSTASTGQRARFIDASSDGTRVFLASRERLAPTDKDDEDDVYATFAGAGFAGAEQPPTLAPCSGGDCREASSPILPDGAPGTADGGGSSGVKSRTRRASVKVLWARERRGLLQVRVRASGEGRVRVSGSTVRPTSRELTRSGVYTVDVPLTRASRKRLRSRGRIAVRLRATLAPPFGNSTKTNYRRTVRK